MSGHCERCGEQVCICHKVFPSDCSAEKVAELNSLDKMEDYDRLKEQLATVTANAAHIACNQAKRIAELEAELTKLRSESEPVACYVNKAEWNLFEELGFCHAELTNIKKQHIPQVPLYLHPQAEGKVLVPIEPTAAMIQALADETEYRVEKKLWKRAYKAMLLALEGEKNGN